MSYTRIDLAMVERIRALAAEGHTAAQIALALDISEHAVRSHARARNITLPGRREARRERAARGAI